MISPAELPPSPKQFIALYHSIGNLAVDFGQPSPNIPPDTVDHSFRTAISSEFLPDNIMRRFPSGLTDLSEFLLLDVYQSEQSDEKQSALKAQADFSRITEPTDPHGRGFRQNQWTVSYTLHGQDTSSLALHVATSGQRKYSLQLASLAHGAGISEKQAAEGFIQDYNADGRTTRLRLPRGFVQPPVTTAEIDHVSSLVRAARQVEIQKDIRSN